MEPTFSVLHELLGDQVSHLVQDCCFHPTEPVVAVGIINGRLQTWSCSAATPSKRICLQAHSESCRAVHFMPQGSLLLSASANKSILAVDAATGKASARREAAHASGINRLLPVSDDTFATGKASDDDGLLKLWDTRQPDAIAALQAHTDFVADLALHQQEHCLLSVSGAGTLSVVDLRTRKIRAQSEEDADDELLSVAVVKGGRKVVAGAQSGVLNLFSWGHFQDCSDRFPGHPASVDALAEFDADTLLTGSSDGVIRIVSILPNRMLGVVGEHDAYPVERLSLSHDRRQLVSASHDNTLMLWDLGFLLDAEDDEEEAAEAEEATEAVVSAHCSSYP
eukprot:jgi/Astpho2/8612/e_gw1.00126.35.1_t